MKQIKTLPRLKEEMVLLDIIKELRKKRKMPTKKEIVAQLTNIIAPMPINTDTVRLFENGRIFFMDLALYYYIYIKTLHEDLYPDIDIIFYDILKAHYGDIALLFGMTHTTIKKAEKAKSITINNYKEIHNQWKETIKGL